MNTNPSIRIWHENLWVTVDNERLPLVKLERNCHVHGGLRLQFGERLVPHLGYFGDDDVCFDAWLTVLWSIAQAFRSRKGFFAYSDGEQGQPCFVFERVDERAYFSILPREGPNEIEPKWNHIRFSPHDFLVEHKRFRSAFFHALKEGAPKTADEWIRTVQPNKTGAIVGLQESTLRDILSRYEDV